MSDLLGHGKLEGRVAGHESCYEIVESRVDHVPIGKFVVILGDDFSGLAQHLAFHPVVPGDTVPEHDLVFDRRGSFFDPRAGYKAVLVVDSWFPGISTLEPATHVYTSLKYVGIDGAQSAIVLGAGLCGQLACQLLHHFGMSHVTAIDTDVERLEFAKRMGFAEATLNPLDDLEEFERLTFESKGAYASIVYDALPANLVSTPVDTRLLASKLVRPNGKWILFGAAERAAFPILPLLAKAIVVQGAPFDSRLISFGQRAAYMRDTFALVDEGILTLGPMVGGPIDFFDLDRVRHEFRIDRAGLPLRSEIRA
jgi:threonine dehydrogenase-like Zn-dependent dehydrogenase